MKILNGLSPSLKIAIPRCRVLWEHGMSVNTRGEDRVIVDTELGMLSEVGVLVAGLPVVKDPPAGGTLKGLDLIFDIEIDTMVKDFGY
jgi:hypothetical protein